MSLEQHLTAWDQTSKDDILEIYERHKNSSDFVANCLALLGVTRAQRGATWLLKHHLEAAEAKLSPADADALISSAAQLAHWESQLHLLQTLPHLRIPESAANAAELFLRACLKSENKFVRAWAYSGFADLAANFPQYRTETADMLDRALLEEEAGSIRARVRHAIKKLR